MNAFSLRMCRRSVLAALAGAPLVALAGFKDPLDTPALKRAVPAERPLVGVAQAGKALIAVGSRGLIIRSEDGGSVWSQCEVPVQSDLLAVHFPSTERGWAVGHDGVVLHSSDGGRTWVRQLDGRSARVAFEDYYSAAATSDSTALARIRQNMGNGPTLPFLDVWFEDEQRGFIVGSFGMIAATVDGGKTWAPWTHLIDNPQQYNLNAVRGIGRDIVIAGEHGSVFVLDRQAGRFRLQDTGYNGSFFGVVGNADSWLAYGLRGVAYRRDNKPAAGWTKVAMPVEQTLTAGDYSAESGFVLVDAAGRILQGDRSGLRWQVRTPEKPRRAAGIAIVSVNTVAIATLEGIQLLTLQGVA
ncbi:MAG TPA: YCF48-related protein [Macromonas sp.]|nr:YCF48-related protein [Macromonas sp.]